MKNNPFLILLLAVASLQVTAQTNKNYNINQVYPGYIITLQNDTIMGFVQNGDRERNQVKCVFFTNADDYKTMKTYKPTELKGYSIEDNHYRSVNYSGNLGIGKAGRNFLLIDTHGRITAYTYYLGDAQLVWQRGDENPVSNASMLMGFRKNMQKLVDDNPELAGKLERKEKGYGMLNINSIIEEYNKWYASKQ